MSLNMNAFRDSATRLLPGLPLPRLNSLDAAVMLPCEAARAKTATSACLTKDGSVRQDLKPRAADYESRWKPNEENQRNEERCFCWKKRVS